ncbi:NPP1-domain-containing protein, partial [Colletotrichum sublineola]
MIFCSCKFTSLSPLPSRLPSLFFFRCSCSTPSVVMLNHMLLCLVLLGLSSLASSSVPYARDGDIAVGDKWKPYDQVEIFQQGAARGLEGILELRFMPMLNDASGCFPYAAVDKDGNHGMGLKPTGKSGGDCRDDSKGQLYARVGTSNGRTGVMYSWYLPKVQTDTEHHKHWYLSIVVWVHSECNPAADDCNIVGVSYSSGAETYDTSMSGETLYSSGHNGTGPSKTHPIVGYDGQVKVFPSQDGDQHALSPPLISWEKLSLAARQQLNGFQYENARCPFNDNNFQASLDAAFNESFYTSLTSRSKMPSVLQPPPPSSRAKGPDLVCMNQGPSFKISNCVFSPIQDDGSVLDLTDAEAILRFMNVKTFMRYFKGSRADLTDTCVFYTKAVSPARKNVGLAITATEWACRESQKRR